MMKTERIAILGLGWLGKPLAKALHENGYSITGSTTSLEKLQALSSQPYKLFQLKLNEDTIEGDPSTFFYEVDTVILNFPPRRIENIEHVFEKQINQLIPFLTAKMNVVFISSTSVYGNTNDWVTEEQNSIPEKASGKALLKVERLLREHCGERLTVLRLAGLIGPNRHPGRFLANKRELSNADAPVNLIHLSDVIGLIRMILRKRAFGLVLNGCADEHPIRKDYYTKAAQLLNLPVPSFNSTGQLSYKLVSNKKSKELLGYEYRYANPEFFLEELSSNDD